MMLQDMPMGQSFMGIVHAILVGMVGWMFRTIARFEKRMDHRIDRLEDAIYKTPPHATEDDE